KVILITLLLQKRRRIIIVARKNTLFRRKKVVSEIFDTTFFFAILTTQFFLLRLRNNYKRLHLFLTDHFRNAVVLYQWKLYLKNIMLAYVILHGRCFKIMK